MLSSDYERSEEHTSELQSPCNLVCRLLLEKKNREQDAEEREVQAQVETPRVHSGLPGEQIPGAAHRLHVPWVARVRLDLLPQPRDVHVDAPVEGIVRMISLHLVEQLIAREHAAAVAGQRAEQ